MTMGGAGIGESRGCGSMRVGVDSDETEDTTEVGTVGTGGAGDGGTVFSADTVIKD